MKRENLLLGAIIVVMLLQVVLLFKPSNGRYVPFTTTSNYYEEDLFSGKFVERKTYHIYYMDTRNGTYKPAQFDKTADTKK